MYDEDLTNLDEWIRRLKIEYHIFFSGNRKNPPDDLRQRAEKLVKRLSESSDMSYSQRFRFTTLISRFYVYRDMWRRTIQEREMGAEPRSAPTAPKTAAVPSSGGSLGDADRISDAVRISISDPKAEEEKVRALYNALLRIRGAGAADTPPSYSQFARYIAAQTRSIREKYACSKVAFTIAMEEDAIRFKAAAEKR